MGRSSSLSDGGSTWEQISGELNLVPLESYFLLVNHTKNPRFDNLGDFLFIMDSLIVHVLTCGLSFDLDFFQTP